MNNGAPLRPSAAARLVACPGSRKMAELYPDEETIDTREGEATHWGGAQLLAGEQIAVGQVADNGVTLTEDMVDAAELYAGHIMQRSIGVGQVEQLVGSGALHPDNYGTPDHWEYDPLGHHLYVDDLKYGRTFVNEIRNWQLIDYTALIAHDRGLFLDDSLKVTMTIVQPRSYHRRGQIRSVTMRLGELRPYFQTLRVAFNAAMQPDAPVIASNPDECMNCSGRTYCEAAIAAGYVGADMAYDSTPLIMSPAALSKEYRMLVRAEKMITARKEGIKQAVMSSIQRGAAVPFFAIAHTKGRLVFREDAAEQGLAEVADAYGVKVTKNAFITPLQAIKAGIPEEVIQMYSHAPGGAAELVEDDGTLAARIFGN